MEVLQCYLRHGAGPLRNHPEVNGREERIPGQGVSEVRREQRSAVGVEVRWLVRRRRDPQRPSPSLYGKLESLPAAETTGQSGRAGAAVKVHRKTIETVLGCGWVIGLEVAGRRKKIRGPKSIPDLLVVLPAPFELECPGDASEPSLRLEPLSFHGGAETLPDRPKLGVEPAGGRRGTSPASGEEGFQRNPRAGENHGRLKADADVHGDRVLAAGSGTSRMHATPKVGEKLAGAAVGARGDASFAVPRHDCGIGCERDQS